MWSYGEALAAVTADELILHVRSETDDRLLGVILFLAIMAVFIYWRSTR
jgi:hypothetical protein